MVVITPILELPWSSSEEENKQYWKILAIVAVPFLILCVLIPFVSIPEADRSERRKLPPQLARIQLEEVKPEPPRVVEPKPTPKPQDTPKPEAVPKSIPSKPPEPKPIVKPLNEKPSAQLVEAAREAATAEINEFTDALNDIKDAFDLDDIATDTLSESDSKVATIDRSVISSGVTTTSGGIDTKVLNRNTGTVKQAGKTTQRVKSKVADIVPTQAKRERTVKESEKRVRSIESIRKVFDRNKARIDSIYNRELRKNPALEGAVVFKLVIDANGKVSSAEIVSSELDDTGLERKLLSRVKSINFGVEEVAQTTTEYTMNFLPF